jgi:hypothetical protein
LPPDYASPVQLIPAGDLGDAAALFGLPIDALPGSTLDQFRERVAGFRTDASRTHETHEWDRLSNVAWEASAALAADDLEKSAEAALWAALFAVHAGNPSARADHGRIS